MRIQSQISITSFLKENVFKCDSNKKQGRFFLLTARDKDGGILEGRGGEVGKRMNPHNQGQGFASYSE